MSKSKVLLILILIILFPLLSFPQTETQEDLIPVDAFFGYDKRTGLNAQEKIKRETENYIGVINSNGVSHWRLYLVLGGRG